MGLQEIFEETDSLFNTKSVPSTFLTDPTKLRIYLYAKPTVITETLIV
jgi:hypothetical protein